MLTGSRESGFTIAVKVSPGTLSTSPFQFLSCIEAHRDSQGPFHNELACYRMRVLAPQPRLPGFHSPLPCRHPGVVWTVLPVSKARCHLYSLFSLASAQVPGPLTYLTCSLTESPDCPKALFEAVFNSCQCSNFQVQTLTLDGPYSAWLRQG